MADIIEGIHPTRMELLEIKKKAKLAQKGHRLLKEKRDALIVEFFEIVKKAKGAKEKLQELMDEGYTDLIKANAILGTNEVRSVAMGRPQSVEVEANMTNIMGVQVPKLTISRQVEQEAVISPMSSPMVDKSTKDWVAITEQILILVEVEEALRRLSEEIKSTKRRVNALEYILLPKLEATQKYIRMRLEEMERENFFRLKTIKKKKTKDGAS